MPTPNPHFLAVLPGISGVLATAFDKKDTLAPHALKPVIDRAIAACVHILTTAGDFARANTLIAAAAA